MHKTSHRRDWRPVRNKRWVGTSAAVAAATSFAISNRRVRRLIRPRPIKPQLAALHKQRYSLSIGSRPSRLSLQIPSRSPQIAHIRR